MLYIADIGVVLSNSSNEVGDVCFNMCVSRQGSRHASVFGHGRLAVPAVVRPVKGRRNIRPAASIDLGMLLAEAKPGDVDAPVSVIIIGAVVVTLASILSGWLLKPGVPLKTLTFCCCVLLAFRKIFMRPREKRRRAHDVFDVCVDDVLLLMSMCAFYNDGKL